MKKKDFLNCGILLLLLAFTSACSHEEDVLSTFEEDTNEVQLDGIKQDIMINVMTNRHGGFNAKSTMSRAVSDVKLTPYVENGDTVLYIAQYSDGWEVYSGSKVTNMVLFSSEHGIFDIEDGNMPNALKQIVKSNAEAIGDLLKSNKDFIVHSSWGAAALTESDFQNGHITVKQKSRSNGRTAISYQDLPPGHWELLTTEILSQENYYSPKLIETEWGQGSPWNIYSKLVQAKDASEYVRAPAGCVPVALGQYFYFTHFKENQPSTTVTTATPTSNNKDFVFSGTSTTLWNIMAKRIGLMDDTNSAALLLGKIGRDLNAIYKAEETAVDTTDIAPYLYNVFKKHFDMVKLNSSSIETSINNGYPVIAHAWTSSSKNGHTFLIDQYKKSETKTKYFYVYKRDPLPPGTIDKWENDDVDEEGNVISYAYTNEIIKEQKSVTGISMNWCDLGYYDETFYYPYGNWSHHGITYDLGHYIYIREK